MTRLKIAAIAGGTALLIALLGYADTTREPEYHGVRLTDWLQQASAKAALYSNIKDAEQAPEMEACKSALRAIGANAVPFLRNDLQARNSWFRAKLTGLSRKRPVARMLGPAWMVRIQNWMVADLVNTNLRHRRAIFAFEVLGPRAESADPTLIRLTQNPDAQQRFWAFAAFAATKPAKSVFMPVATRLLKDPDQAVQVSAATGIIERFPADAEALGIYKTFPQLLYLRPKAAP